MTAAENLAQDMADAIPGDANFDGTVNLADFNALAGNFGRQGLWWKYGDFNFDGSVSLADFNQLAGNFGQSGRTRSCPSRLSAVRSSCLAYCHAGVVESLQ